MAIGMNDLAVTNLYASLGAGKPPLSVIAPNTPFYIVIHTQAGDTAWDEGIHYRLRVLLQDVTDGYRSVLNTTVQGNLQDASWKTQSCLFHLATVSGVAGTVYQSLVFLTAGFRNPEVSFRVDFPILVQ